MKKKILLLSILAALAGTMTGCSVSLNQGSGAAASRAGAGKTQESVRTDIVDDDEADAGTDTDGTTDPDEGDSAADESPRRATPRPSTSRGTSISMRWTRAARERSKREKHGHTAGRRDRLFRLPAVCCNNDDGASSENALTNQQEAHEFKIIGLKV